MIVRALTNHLGLIAFIIVLTIVRASMLMPVAMYDWIAERNSFRE